MTDIQSLGKLLSRSFCEEIRVHAVPAGYAISMPFEDDSGDRISFYARPSDDGGYTLEDDGAFLAHLVASGIDIERGQRQLLLDTVLSSSGAYWDRDTFEIRSNPLSGPDLGRQTVRFLSALLRVRDLELLTKQVIRSTFREDALAGLRERFAGEYRIDERSALSSALNEYPADVVLRPQTKGREAAIFFVSSATQFLEAEVLHAELRRANLTDRYATIALIEDAEKLNVIGLKRYQRAVNRGLATPIFRGDEVQAMSLVEDRLAA